MARTPEQVDRVIDALMRAQRQDRALLREVANGAINSPELIIGTSTSFDPSTNVPVLPKYRARLGYGLASVMSYLGLDRLGRWIVSENDGTARLLDGWVFRPEITLTAASATTFDITETSTGYGLPLERKTVLLVQGGLVQYVSGTDGSIDANTDFTLDAGGTRITMATAPGVTPGQLFFVQMARRKAAI